MHLDQSIIDIVRTALIIVIKISGPILAAGVAIGLLISIVQSVTQIQEQTLVFVPKIFSMILVAILLMHWVVQRLADFAIDMFTLG
ncbi:MAG: flagellar biosynthetic protein FliQ [Phycisphaerales bacterium]